MVASYNSKVNTVNAQSAKLNEGIMNAIVDPNKLDLGQCMGDISSVYNQIVKNAEKINDQLEILNQEVLNNWLAHSYPR